MAVILSCKDVTFRFEKKQVLKQVSFSIEAGQFCAILGRNGSGKTTLIQCLNRILKPQSGRIEIMSKDLMTCSRNEIAQLVSLVPQEHLDIFPYRVLDVVVMGRAPFIKSTAKPCIQDYKDAMAALKELNARKLASKNFNRISGGERQIVLLARAIAQASKVMLLDEPTNHLDFNNQYHLLGTIGKLCRARGISIVASMHDPNLASFFADRVVMLKKGRVIQDGYARDVMTARTISDLYEAETRCFDLPEGRQMFVSEHIFS